MLYNSSVNPEDKSYIDKLKESLYSRNGPLVQSRRRLSYEDENSNLKRDWEHKEIKKPEPIKLNTQYKDQKMSFFTKLFIFSAVFCVVVVGIGAYIFFRGGNLIRADNININISGPVSIPGGEPVSFDITTINNNNIDLQLAEMTIEYPSGTTDPNNSAQILKDETKFIGNIKAGESFQNTIKAIIFGEENVQKQIKVTLTYGIKGSTSSFTKIKTYDVLINSSPINMTVTTLEEITSGQEFDMKIGLVSNSENNLKNILVKATYPFGFEYTSSSFAPVGDNATWFIGDIPPGGKREFTIRGKVVGEDSDLRVFNFYVGSRSSDNVSKIGTEYMSIQKDLLIQKPFVTLNIEVNGDSDNKDSVGQFGQSSRVTIKWFNNLSTIVSNMKITANISGTAYDKASLSPGEGYFNSGTDTITWSEQTNRELASVGPGESGTVEFNVIPKDFGTPGQPITNPRISINASVSGRRTQETNVPLSVSSSAKRNIIISSRTNLSGRITRTGGPFENSGFVPPKADMPTTYTITWNVDNTVNTVGDVVVKATLPPYVKWLNVFSPTDQDISYDENSGLITWNVGNVYANSSGSSSRKQVSFQVSFTPSVTQVGTIPVIVNQASLVGIDSFTHSEVKSYQDQLTTRFSTDPGYKSGDELVQK